MEKNRWSLIFIGLCLIFAFSVTSVEAQMHHDCTPCAHCDRDGDGLIKDTPPCRTSCPDFMIDTNDRSPNTCGGEDPEPVKVFICHFKNTLKHCSDGAGGFVGGGEIEVFFDSKAYLRHLEHGDCIENNYSPPDASGCFGHCIADGPGPRCDGGEALP